MIRQAVLLMAFFWASAAFAQPAVPPSLAPEPQEPQLELGQRNFSLPVIDYRAPDGTWKRGHGIIIGRDIAPNATVGLGFFKMKPKYQDTTVPTPAGGKSKKMSLGVSVRF